jgi:muramoyltetrapeptide carboxypeptidase
MQTSKLTEIRKVAVIAPAGNGDLLSQNTIDIAASRLREMGLEPVFYPTTFRALAHTKQDKIDRAHDINSAFADPDIAGLLSILGGFASVHVLEHLDFDLIKANPKFFCGYSDITIMNTALYSKADLITFSGPHFSTFGAQLGIDYLIKHFKEIAFENKKIIHYTPSDSWSNDEWYIDQADRNFVKNDGPLIINEGHAKGTLIGGNLCTITLLNGTSYLKVPDDNIILFIEDDFDTHFDVFDRMLFALTEAIGRDKIKGILLGRFEKASNMSNDDIKRLFQHREYFKHIPIIANIDFGHTLPAISIPYGGTAEISASNEFIFNFSASEF